MNIRLQPNKNEIGSDKRLTENDNNLQIISLINQQKNRTFQKLLEKSYAKIGSKMNNSFLTMNSDIKQFKMFGASVYLYFSFVKLLIYLFIVLSVISIIPIAYNCITGQSYSGAWTFNAKFAKTTIGSHSISQDNNNSAKIVNTVCLCMNLTLLFAFWMYWKQLLLRDSAQIQKELALSNCNSIVVEPIKQEYITADEIMRFMEKFGKIDEVVEVKNMGETLFIAKKILQIKVQIELLQKKRLIQEFTQDQLAEKMLSLSCKIQQLNKQLKDELEQTSQIQNKHNRYIVQFQDHESFNKVTQQFEEYQGCCCTNDLPQQMTIGGKQIKISQQDCQPCEIYWQNQYVSLVYNAISNILLLVIINGVAVITIIFISLLLASATPVYYIPTYQSNNYNQSAIFLLSNATIKASWCLSNTYTSTMSDLCTYYQSLHRFRMAIYVGIGFLVVIAKLIIKQIVLGMRKTLRFKNKVQQSQKIMFHLFINYTIISILITLCLQTNLFGSAMGNIVESCVSSPFLLQNLELLLQYYDYNSQWYLEYGFQLALNLSIMVLFPHILSPIFESIILKIKKYTASKKNLQEQIEEELELNRFELQDHYASVLMVLFVGLLFSGGMPIMIPLVLLSLITRYIISKYLFLYLNKVPQLMNRTLVNKTSSVLVIIITTFLLNSIWAFGVQSIFSTQNPLFSERGIDANSNAHGPLEALMVFFRRLANCWPPVIIYTIGIICICLRQLMTNIFLKYLQKDGVEEISKKKVNEIYERQIVLIVNNSTADSFLGKDKGQKSYRLQNNPVYSKILQYIDTMI